MKQLFTIVLAALLLAFSTPVLAADAASDTLAAPVTVNINAAGVEKLQALPGIGPVTAERIIDYRAENGAFSDLNDLTEVRGIGAKTLAKIRPQLAL